jgi:ABC-type glycerol-3-phosphate transport system permease component
LYIAVVVTVLNLLFCSLAGYAFAMFEFRFKNLMFIGIMATMLLPPFLGMIPTAMIMSTIGWMNDPKALRALQGTAGQVPWGAVSLGATIAVLPLLFLFIMASRRLIDGLTAGAVKG